MDAAGGSCHNATIKWRILTGRFFCFHFPAANFPGAWQRSPSGRSPARPPRSCVPGGNLLQKDVARDVGLDQRFVDVIGPPLRVVDQRRCTGIAPVKNVLVQTEAEGIAHFRIGPVKHRVDFEAAGQTFAKTLPHQERCMNRESPPADPGWPPVSSSQRRLTAGGGFHEKRGKDLTAVAGRISMSRRI